MSTKKLRQQQSGPQMTTFPSRFLPLCSLFPCKHNNCLLFGGLIASKKKGPCGFALAVINQGHMAQQETSQRKHNCHVCLSRLSPRSPQDSVCLNGNNNEADAQLNNECFPFCLMNPRLQKNHKIRWYGWGAGLLVMSVYFLSCAPACYQILIWLLSEGERKVG